MRANKAGKPSKLAEISGIGREADSFPDRARDMTLRDYFAGQAMKGMIPNHTRQVEDGHCGYITQLAYVAYEVADAMLKQRVK